MIHPLGLAMANPAYGVMLGKRIKEQKEEEERKEKEKENGNSSSQKHKTSFRMRRL